MALIKTPYMGLTLSQINNDFEVGTLPQDWALWINYNLMVFDGHDHSELGNQIPSIDLEVSFGVDLGSISVKNLSSISFEPLIAAVPLHAPALFTDALDLFFISTALNDDGTRKVAQITNAGSVPSDVGGFFGDYAVSQARAAFDGPTNSFTFYGALSAQNATVKALGFQGIRVNISGASTMTSTAILNATTAKFTDPNRDYGNSVLVRQPNSSVRIANVVGDGSEYILSGPGESNNVPIVNKNIMFRLNNTETTALIPALTAISNYGAGNENQETMTLEYRSLPLKQTWLPTESATIDLLGVAPSVNIPNSLGAVVNVISAKTMLFSPVLTVRPNPLYFWAWSRIDFININPSSHTNAIIRATFQNRDPRNQRSFNDASTIIIAVVKLNITYSKLSFFGR